MNVDILAFKLSEVLFTDKLIRDLLKYGGQHAEPLERVSQTGRRRRSVKAAAQPRMMVSGLALGMCRMAIANTISEITDRLQEKSLDIVNWHKYPLATIWSGVPAEYNILRNRSDFKGQFSAVEELTMRWIISIDKYVVETDPETGVTYQLAAENLTKWLIRIFAFNICVNAGKFAAHTQSAKILPDHVLIVYTPLMPNAHERRETTWLYVAYNRLTPNVTLRPAHRRLLVSKRKPGNYEEKLKEHEENFMIWIDTGKYPAKMKQSRTRTKRRQERKIEVHDRPSPPPRRSQRQRSNRGDSRRPGKSSAKLRTGQQRMAQLSSALRKLASGPKQ